jgi:hypothetical protein
MYFDVGAAQVYLFDSITGSFLPAGTEPSPTEVS